MKTLADARSRADRILKDLLQQQAQLAGDVRSIDATRLAQGQIALASAIASARGALAALDDAIAAVDSLSKDQSHD